MSKVTKLVHMHHHKRLEMVYWIKNEVESINR